MKVLEWSSEVKTLMSLSCFGIDLDDKKSSTYYWALIFSHLLSECWFMFWEENGYRSRRDTQLFCWQAALYTGL